MAGCSARLVARLNAIRNLPPEANDHPLLGEWKSFREFHLGGDLLLIYKTDLENNQVVLVRIGSHSQLFK